MTLCSAEGNGHMFQRVYGLKKTHQSGGDRGRDGMAGSPVIRLAPQQLAGDSGDHQSHFTKSISHVTHNLHHILFSVYVWAFQHRKEQS